MKLKTKVLNIINELPHPPKWWKEMPFELFIFREFKWSDPQTHSTRVAHLLYFFYEIYNCLHKTKVKLFSLLFTILWCGWGNNKKRRMNENACAASSSPCSFLSVGLQPRNIEKAPVANKDYSFVCLWAFVRCWRRSSKNIPISKSPFSHINYVLCNFSMLHGNCRDTGRMQRM